MLVDRTHGRHDPVIVGPAAGRGGLGLVDEQVGETG